MSLALCLAHCGVVVSRLCAARCARSGVSIFIVLLCFALCAYIAVLIVLVWAPRSGLSCEVSNVLCLARWDAVVSCLWVAACVNMTASLVLPLFDCYVYGAIH